MQENLMRLEVALNNLELQMRLHKVAVNNNPGHYSGSYKLAQTLIFESVEPAFQEVRQALETVKNEGELVHGQTIRTA
ncbi:hypothetical protein ABE096_14150 [Robertmurraya massiliosenegalensis]|uniref:hypothetical protein n=1 Tax=Robertmurraya TaxID=2837507 RepID=UPI0039A6BB5E